MDKVLRDVLYLGFRIVLQNRPSLGTEFVDFRRFVVTRTISGYLVKSVYGDKYYISVLICDFYNFLNAVLVIPDPYQTTEYPYST